MLFTDGATSVESAFTLANMLSRLPSPGAQATIDALLVLDVNQPVRSFLQRSRGLTCPTWYYAQCDAGTLLLINCTENLLMAQEIYNGYVSEPNVGERAGRNGWATGAAASIQTDLASQHFGAPQNLLVAGFSAGGMVADYYADLLLSQGLGYQPVRISFGAPKSGAAEFWGRLSSNFACRWMNREDAVPLIPPNTFPAATLFTLGNAFIAWRTGRFYHGSGGIAIAANGTITPSTLPSDAAFRPSISLASWLLNCEGDVGTAHPISIYVDRLRATKQLYVRPQDQRPQTSPQEAPNPPHRQEANRQAEAAVNAIFATGVEQNAQPLVIAGGGPCYAFRNGRVWQVAFGQTVIAVGPTKRHARAIANSLNAWARHLQTAGIVDPEAILNQMRDYLIQAADPTGGFSPLMQQTIPRFGG